MSTWYEVAKYRNAEIRPVRVVKETDRMLVLAPAMGDLGPPRVGKRSEWRSYFPTWEEARDALLDRNQRIIKRATQDIEQATADIAQLEAMTPPGAP